jgi:hypothetical protein
LLRSRYTVSRSLALGLALILVLAVWPAPCKADKFAAYGMRVLDRITEIAPADLNGDGYEDLVVLHTKGRTPDIERWISVFWHKPDGGFSSAADLTWRLPEEVAAVDVGDVSEDPGMEIIALTPEGASIIDTETSGSFSLESIVSGVKGAILPSRDDVPIVDFVQDWNGDGRDDVAIFGSGELYLFLTDGNGLSSSPQICELETEIGLSVERGENGPRLDEVSVTRRLPNLSPVDLEGDGDNDLVAYWDNEVRFYLQENGRFSATPDAASRLDLITEEDREEDDYRFEVSVVDVDGDGMADLFGGKSIGRGVGDFSSTVALHYGDGGLDFGAKPDWSTTVEGMSAGQWLDMDGDGRVELMLPVIDLGITDIVRILVTKNVKIGFNFYFPAGDRKISQEPDFVKEVTLEVGFEEGGQAQIVNFEGDYNGDGRKDLVAATGRMELSVFLGKEPSKGELFSKKPVDKIEVDTFGDFQPLDLNGDGLDDMILYYRGQPEKSSRAKVFINSGDW